MLSPPDAFLFRRSDNIIELTEETQVVLEIEAQVAYLVFQHCHTLNPHAQSKARILLAVDAASLKDIGVHHAATEYFEPSRMLAYIAPLAMAYIA